MAKPICVIYFPENLAKSDSNEWIFDYMRFLNGEKNINSKNKFEYSDYFTQYYWFCFHKEGINEPEFKVFYEKDFTEIQYKELKEIIENSLKKVDVGEGAETESEL